MVSLELLRACAFCGALDDAQRTALAQIADEFTCEAGATLFEEGQSADSLYLLLSGSVDLYFNPPQPYDSLVLIGGVNPGEPFAISALIAPYVLKHTARAGTRSHLLRINAAKLRALCEKDFRMGYFFMRNVAQAAMERLHFTRVQLAAERV